MKYTVNGDQKLHKSDKKIKFESPNVQTMTPNFFALFNKSGIACAADADHTIFRLAKSLPVAIAVNPSSKIPWEKILQDYKQSTQVQERLTMAEYAADFGAYLASVPAGNNWGSLLSEDLNIIFFGYGSGDIFPSVCDVCAEVVDGVLNLGEACVKIVGGDEIVLCHLLGDFENVSTLIWGSTSKVRSFFYEKDKEMFQVYKGRVTDRFKGTKYEDYVSECFAGFDAESKIASGLDSATDNVYASFMTGVGSFSVEDMVTAVESIVKSNSELSYIRSGAKGNPPDVKEIAVLTIPEGLSWIKHSLYYRRNDI